LDEEIEIKLDGEEQNVAIENAALLKEGIASSMKESTDLKKKKARLSKANAAARAEVLAVEKEVGCHRKPIRKGIEAILAKEWNIKRPSWHGGDILGDECRKSMAFARLVCNKMKVFLRAELDENEAPAQAREKCRSGVTSSPNICCCSMASFLFHGQSTKISLRNSWQRPENAQRKPWQCLGHCSSL
jgi:hypothetical protein